MGAAGCVGWGEGAMVWGWGSTRRNECVRTRERLGMSRQWQMCEVGRVAGVAGTLMLISSRLRVGGGGGGG